MDKCKNSWKLITFAVIDILRQLKIWVKHIQKRLVVTLVLRVAEPNIQNGF